jgi:hypothetical protein
MGHKVSMSNTQTCFGDNFEMQCSSCCGAVAKLHGLLLHVLGRKAWEFDENDSVERGLILPGVWIGKGKSCKVNDGQVQYSPNILHRTALENRNTSRIPRSWKSDHVKGTMRK